MKSVWRAIRADIPIVLCTGYSDAVTPERADALGLAELAYKPLAPGELAQLVRRVLSGAATA